MLIHVTIVASLVVLRAILACRTEPTERQKARIKIVEQTAIVWCVVFLVVQPLFLQPFVVANRSMSPSLRPGDTVLISKATYWLAAPRRWDMVVFRPRSDQLIAVHQPAEDLNEKRTLEANNELFFVKRVVGLPGETIEVVNGQIFVDGAVVEHAPILMPIPYDMAPVVVPEGSIFVLGDNVQESWDSHNWGPLPIQRVVGRVVAGLWPLSRLGLAR